MNVHCCPTHTPRVYYYKDMSPLAPLRGGSAATAAAAAKERRAVSSVWSWRLGAAALVLAAVSAVRQVALRRAPPPTAPPVITARPPAALLPRVAAPGDAPVAGAFTVLYLNATVTAGPYPVDFSCFTSSGSPLSCSPSWCNSSSAVLSGASTQSCVPNATSQNYATLVPAVGCKSCTTSTDARCTTAFLTATFGRFSSIYAAYCDSSRLVLLTDTRGAGVYNLDNVPSPPGGFNAAWPYAACRTRTASLTPAWSILTFPLAPSLYSSAATTNNANVYPGPQNGENGPLYNSITMTQYNIPASGKVGSTITGQDVFPVFNNRATFTSENCEVDACNEHIGQGFGQPHLHGDPFGPTCLYSAANYTVNGVANWTAHPPLIGIADDGLWIYGRYLSSAAPGGNIALDICGGHSHGGSAYGQSTSGGYHYHTQLIAATSSGLGSGTSTVGLAYPQTTTGPYQCFMGNLSAE